MLISQSYSSFSSLKSNKVVSHYHTAMIHHGLWLHIISLFMHNNLVYSIWINRFISDMDGLRPDVNIYVLKLYLGYFPVNRRLVTKLVMMRK